MGQPKFLVLKQIAALVKCMGELRMNSRSWVDRKDPNTETMEKEFYRKIDLLLEEAVRMDWRA